MRFDVAIALESRQLAVELPQQLGTDASGTDEADGQRLAREVQAGMCGAQRTLHVAPVDDDGDVALG
jgi:hypothetical protein